MVILGPGGGFGRPGGGFRTGRSSGKPLLIPMLKEPPLGSPKPPPGPPKSPPGQLEMGTIRNESTVYRRLFVDSEVPGGFKKVRVTGRKNLDLVSVKSNYGGPSYDRNKLENNDY